MRNLNEIANALEATNCYVIERTTDKYDFEYVKVTDSFLWPDLNIIFLEGEDGVEWHLRVPANWNGTIEPYQLEDMNEFVGNVMGIVKED